MDNYFLSLLHIQQLLLYQLALQILHLLQLCMETVLVHVILIYNHIPLYIQTCFLVIFVSLQDLQNNIHLLSLTFQTLHIYPYLLKQLVQMHISFHYQMLLTLLNHLLMLEVLLFCQYNKVHFRGPTPNAGFPQEYAAFTIPVPPVAKIKFTPGWFINNLVAKILGSSIHKIQSFGAPASTAASLKILAAVLLHFCADG